MAKWCRSERIWHYLLVRLLIGFLSLAHPELYLIVHYEIVNNRLYTRWAVCGAWLVARTPRSSSALRARRAPSPACTTRPCSPRWDTTATRPLRQFIRMQPGQKCHSWWVGFGAELRSQNNLISTLDPYPGKSFGSDPNYFKHVRKCFVINQF